MRILLLTSYFPPDTGSAAHLFYELGKALVERSHQVAVITGIPSYHAVGAKRDYGGEKRVHEVVDGIEVTRVWTPQLPRHLMFARAAWQFTSAITFLRAAKRASPVELIMAYSPPLPLGLTGWRLKRSRKVPFVLNVQDLFPQSVIDLGLLKNRLLIWIFRKLERFVYNRADRITVHSEGNFNYIASQGRQSPSRIAVVPNWVDTDFLRPGERKNEFSRKHGLDNRFVASFAGVIGYSQDLDVVLDAARLTREDRDLLWLIVGDGVEKARLQEHAESEGLENVKFLPMQPRDLYPILLDSSDVGLVTLRPEVLTPVVPSKILSIMAAGKPVVAALPGNGDAPKLIRDARCGICVEPGDPEALAGAVKHLYEEKSKAAELGVNGRRYAVEVLSLKARVTEYEDLFKSLLNSE